MSEGRTDTAGSVSYGGQEDMESLVHGAAGIDENDVNEAGNAEEKKEEGKNAEEKKDEEGKRDDNEVVLSSGLTSDRLRQHLAREEEIRRELNADSFDKDQDRHLRNYVKGSREWIHKRVDEWLGNESKQIFWLCAEAGMGKSAFVASLHDRLKTVHKAVYFCKFGDEGRSRVGFLVKSIAYQVAKAFFEYREHLLTERILEKIKGYNEDVNGLFRELIVAPLRTLSPGKRLLIIIDALDEIGAVGSSERKRLLNLLNEFTHLPTWVKLLVTSRPDEDIIQTFNHIEPETIKADDPRQLDDLKSFIRSEIHRFILQQRKRKWNQDSDYSVENAVDQLMTKSEGRFIYMTMVADLLKVETKTLEEILEQFPSGLDNVYLSNFQRLHANNPDVYDSKVKPLLSLLVTMREPLIVKDIQSLLGYSVEEILSLSDQIKSMFPLSERTENGFFSVFHKTVLDWVTNPDKARKAWNLTDMITMTWLQSVLPDTAHETINNYFNQLTSNYNVKTFYNLKDISDNNLWNTLDFLDDADRIRFPSCLDQRYFYDYYVDVKTGNELFCNKMRHQITGRNDDDSSDGQWADWEFNGAVEYMCKHLIHHMLEAGLIDEARRLITQLQWLLKCVEVAGISTLRIDAERLLMSNTGDEPMLSTMRMICQAVLMMSPRLASRPRSMTQSLLVLELLGRLKPIRYEDNHNPFNKIIQSCQKWWDYRILEINRIYPLVHDLEIPGGPLEKSIAGHKGVVSSLCVWNNRIVSGSYDKTIKIWNPDTGDCDRSLIDHQKQVLSLCVWNNRIVSGSYDKTTKIWNPDTGECDRTLIGHEGGVLSLCVWNNRIVSGSDDKTIKIWNPDTGQCDRSLKGHVGGVSSLYVFNGFVVSGSWDKTIKIWNPDTRDAIRTMKGHDGWVTSLCVSRNRIVSGSEDKTIKIWNPDTGDCERTLNEPWGSVKSLCVLNDRIVSGSWDKMIKIWNPDNGECDRTLRGHEGVLSLHVFNDRIVSGSQDKTIKIWNPYIGQYDGSLRGHEKLVLSLCILKDRVVSGSDDMKIKIWNPDTGECDRTLVGHEGGVLSLYGRNDLIVSGSYDNTIKIWNPDTGECDRTLRGHEKQVLSLCMLKDRVVSGSADNTIKIWNPDTGHCDRTFVGHNEGVSSLLVWNDRVVSGSWDKTIKIWNPDTGDCERSLSGHGGWVTSISMWNNRILSGSYDTTIKIWNPDTGECDRTLIGHEREVISLSLWNDCIVSKSLDKKIIVWNLDEVNDLSYEPSKHMAIPVDCYGISMISRYYDDYVRMLDCHLFPQCIAVTLEGRPYLHIWKRSD